jgi:hypothetical protein
MQGKVYPPERRVLATLRPIDVELSQDELNFSDIINITQNLFSRQVPR